MRYKIWSIVIVCLPFCSLPARASGPSTHSSRALVCFVATSTSIHDSYSGSEDVFLAEAQIGRNTTPPILIKLVDQYPVYRVPISPQILRSTTGTWLHLRRDPECDVSFFEMPLRTAPGDPTAILAEPLVFRPQLPLSTTPDAILSCYHVVRR